jgi:D-alanyl-D-alanine carboxypeptidase/D-alanyl-D-alanine-endopeptidase (penicillin-binding protein 4)
MAALAVLAALSWAPLPAALAAGALPPSVLTELQRARIPVDAVSVVIEPVGPGAGSGPRLHLREHAPVNPASLMKLPTTMMALDRLGPAHVWVTPAWLAGPVVDGVLQGDLHLQGQGDPALTLERLWLLLRRVQALGVREIRGDIVLDSRALAVPTQGPGDFDGEPLRPYNVQPQALLLNQATVTYSFSPDTAQGVARVSRLPAMAGAEVQATVPLAAGPCGDWRRILQASFGTDGRVQFSGRYPAACGPRQWPVADPMPATYNARLLQALWTEMGGTLTGRVREGPAPQGAPTLVHASPPLAEVVRDINKFSNNPMAELLFLALGRQVATPPRVAVRAPERPGVGGGVVLLTPAEAAGDAAAPAAEPEASASAALVPGAVTPEAARAAMRSWLLELLGEGVGGLGGVTGAVIDNGSGLSRSNRLSAAQLGRLLQRHFDSPTMPELMASLPVTGLDGTLRRSRASAGRAHLKTGSLRDVAGLAGYLLADSGQRYVFVALVQHPAAGSGAARPALDALVDWALRDLPTR